MAENSVFRSQHIGVSLSRPEARNGKYWDVCCSMESSTARAMFDVRICTYYQAFPNLFSVNNCISTTFKLTSRSEVKFFLLWLVCNKNEIKVFQSREVLIPKRGH